MATVAAQADQASNLLEKLSIDAQPYAVEMPEPTKKHSAKPYAADLGNPANWQFLPIDRSHTPVEFDPNMFYHPNGYPPAAYYYEGYNGTQSDWEDYSRYNTEEGVDNGLFSYGYSPYVPVNDQLYSTPRYHYPSPYLQHMAPSTVPYSATQRDLSASADHKPLLIEVVNANSNATENRGVKGDLVNSTVKSMNQNSFNSNGCYGRGSIASEYQDPGFAFGGVCSPVPCIDGVFSYGQYGAGGMTNFISNASNFQSSRSVPFHPNPHFVGLNHPRPISGIGATNAFMTPMYPNNYYNQYGFGGWLPNYNKYKNKGRGNTCYGYRYDSTDGLNEVNRGPRTQSLSPPNTTTTDVTSLEVSDKKIVAPDRDQYNNTDFPEEYADAKFFVIKSYSEDDVHKSVKYNVWASTPNGNKKLDAAYRESQEKLGGCPIFLFFSVNTSGQFVGVAEMTGPVDFDKKVEYWQQDKWYGCFPVKWHIVKDVPNSSLKHIILENNENKPVTNSRDTQEVKLEHGMKMVKIFKEYSSKTCLLDDFEFYETREKAILEKKAKQAEQKQVWEGKLNGEKKDTGVKSVEGALELNREAAVPVA